MQSLDVTARSQQDLIAELANPDEPKRQLAAGMLFEMGRLLSRDTVERWERDPEFAIILLRGSERTDDTLPGALRTTVGIAVTPSRFSRIRTVNGMPRLADVPPDQDAAEFELHFSFPDPGMAIRLDILTTKQPGGKGAIAKFLAKFGEGIQQVEYEVSDVDRATRILADRFGVKAVYPMTRAGADATRVNFFLVPAAPGTKVLIELVEHASVAR